MQAVILAGGKGARLQARLGDLPKPMVPIGGRPLLEHQILLARRHGFRDIVLLLGYRSSAVVDWFGEGEQYGVRIRSIVERSPLGSAGAVLAALDALDDQFLVMYGDTMLNVDLRRFWRAHEESAAAASLFVHPNDHPQDSDLIEADANGRIFAFHPYPHDPAMYYPNMVNAALYVLQKSAIASWRGSTSELDFGRNLFPAMLAAGSFLYAYRSPEYLKDAGTPERLDSVNADFAAGRIARGSLETATPAIFLDRDGTVNVEVDRVKSPEEFHLLDSAAEAIRLFNKAGFRVVIITNQPVIARGDCSYADLAAIHNKMDTLLGRAGAYVDATYFCPHHPDKGFSGERPELKIRCSCRKPDTGLIERACRELNIDLTRSWMVGDTTVDIRTARAAGLRAVLVHTGYGGRDGRFPDQPDFSVPTLLHAAEMIINTEGGRSYS